MYFYFMGKWWLFSGNFREVLLLLGLLPRERPGDGQDGGVGGGVPGILPTGFKRFPSIVATFLWKTRFA